MSQNFLLHPPTHDAEPPAHPHFACADGYAWAPEPGPAARDRRACYQGHTAARAELVAGVLSGRPIDRVWCLRRLLFGEPGDRYPGVLVALWPDHCRGCGGDHTDDAIHWRRAAVSIHPGALEELRRGDPSLRQLLNVDVPVERRYKQRGTDGQRARRAGLPVRATDAETERAQEHWALDLAARRAHPIHVPRKRRASTG